MTEQSKFENVRMTEFMMTLSGQHWHRLTVQFTGQEIQQKLDKGELGSLGGFKDASGAEYSIELVTDDQDVVQRRLVPKDLT